MKALLPLLFLFSFLAFLGFVAVHAPYVHNNTDESIEVSLTFSKATRSVKLAPHAARCEGQVGLVLAGILVRYGDGRTRKLSSHEIAVLRQRKHVEKELWVVQPNSIDLFDLSYARWLKHR